MKTRRKTKLFGRTISSCVLPICGGFYSGYEIFHCYRGRVSGIIFSIRPN